MLESPQKVVLSPSVVADDKTFEIAVERADEDEARGDKRGAEGWRSEFTWNATEEPPALDSCQEI